MRGVFFLVFMVSLLDAKAIDYQLFEQDGKFGVKDQEGKVVITPAFDGLGWSDGSFSIVGQVTGYKVQSHWGLINLKGQRVTNADFINLIPSGGDRVIVKKEINPASVKMGCIDLRGNITVPLKYDGIKIIGLQAIVFNKSESTYNYGVISLNGNIIIPLIYKKIITIGSLRYGVYNSEKKAALFTEAGIKLTDFYIDSISSFHNNRAIIYQGVNQGVINRDGRIELLPQYREITYDNNDKLKGRAMTQWLLLDSNNQTMKSATGDELLPKQYGITVRNGNQYGIWNNELNPIIPIEYDDLQQFDSNFAVAKKGNKFGLIQSDNTVIFPFQFDSIRLSEKFVHVQEKLLGKPSWILYDIYGIRKSERSYEYISAFNGKFFHVKNYGLSGIMDRYGNETVHCVYDSILAFSENQLIVKFHDHYGIIDFNENWILPPQPFPVRLVDDEHYLQQEYGTNLFKNFNGDLIYFTDNSLNVKGPVLKEILSDGTEKEISFQGVTISRTTSSVIDNSEIISGEHEGLRGIKRDGKYGFIDKNGSLRIANRYEAIGNFKDGMAAVKILGKWGFINTKDNIVINPSYQYVSEFMDGIAIVKRGKYGLLDKEGNMVLETRYDSIYQLGTNNFLISNKELVGLASSTGVVLIDPRFDKLQDLGNGFVIVSRDNKYGLLTQAGLSTIPMIYDQLFFLEKENKFLAKKESPMIQLNLN